MKVYVIFSEMTFDDMPEYPTEANIEGVFSTLKGAKSFLEKRLGCEKAVPWGGYYEKQIWEDGKSLGWAEFWIFEQTVVEWEG